MVLPIFGEVLDDAAIQARVEKMSAIEGDPVAAEAAKIWAEALEASKAADLSIAKEKGFRAEIARLDALKSLELPRPPEGELSLQEKEEFLKTVRSSIDESERRLDDIEAKKSSSGKRVTTLIEEITKVKASLSDLSVPALAPGTLEAALHQKGVQEKRRLEARLAEFTAEQELLRRESDLFIDRMARRKDFTKKLKGLGTELFRSIKKAQEQESLKNQKFVESLEEEFSGVPELISILAEIKRFREREKNLGKGLQQAREYRESVVEIRDKIDEQFRSAKGRIELLRDAKMGIDDETGMLLRRQRARLPSVDELSAELKDKLERAARAELSLMTLSDEVNDLSSPSDEQIEKILIDHPKVSRKRIDELLEQRSGVLRNLDKTLRDLKKELNEGTGVAKLTIDEIEDYSTFIDERLLWIKSTKTLHWKEPVAEWGRVIDLFKSDGLGAALKSMEDEFFEKIVLVLLVILISLGVFFRRGRLRMVLEESSHEAARRNCTSIVPTLKFIGAAVLLSSWVSLPVWCVSELVTVPVFWKVALLRLSTFLFFSSLFLKFARPHGLFVSHFKMEPERAAIVFTNLKWLSAVAPVFVFLVPALTLSEENTEAGRFVFIVAMLISAGFVHHLFHPKGTILGDCEASGGVVKLIYVLLMTIPVVFVVGAGLGYFASVLTLRNQVAATAGLLVLAFLVMRFLTRWTLVSRRGLAISQAMRRREVALAHREMEAEGQTKSEEVPSLDEVKAEAVNVVEVEEQTTQLLKFATYLAVFFGLWMIWSSTWPALKVLDEVELWKDEPVVVEKKSEAPSVRGLSAVSGKDEASPPEAKVAKMIRVDDGRVTLQDLLLSLVFFVLTFVAARNIPSLLSLTLFSRIKLGPGGNFALTTTARYLIVLVGIVIALAQIGVTWGKVQWLAAAVSLGIGFGLQEIFANFVAGIILLFERPIRLGDIVTVGDISGKVTQIKIRATTIQQFNNRELLVPNKEFITSQLVNWTLKDSVLRFEIPIGIAYGSDTEKASRILREIVEGHEKVLDDPAPAILFSSFGNSTLDFLLRGFVASVDDLLPTQSEIHYQIDNAFREAKIEIAFPQQDIHLRSLPEGVKMVSQS
ncbi:mechanosensitive ion channel [Akkermansiaceae bacterium]|nr:mechanosensitive ion channel [Akkermansiaceae bacterium]MDA7929358.1 mechanosensitive ion channel [Akkermansiaceae bacterium]